MMGRDESVLLLHGALAGGIVWRRVRRELQGDVGVIAPDLPGFGGNRAAAGVGSLEAYVEFASGLVERERPTHIVGYSMGGIVALALAARHPDLVQGVGLIGLPVYPDRRVALEYLARRGAVVRAFLQSDRVAHGACVAARNAWPFWHAWASRRYPLQSKATIRAVFVHSEAAHRALGEVVFGGHVERLAAAAPVPVAALHGRSDRAAPLGEVERLAGEWNWALTTDDNATHQLIVERPRYVADWIRRAVLQAESTQASRDARSRPAGTMALPG